MNVWKLLTIVLAIVVVLETSIIIWAWNTGTDLWEAEYDCANDICWNAGAETYAFDDTTGYCSCYKDGEVVHQEKLIE